MKFEKIISRRLLAIELAKGPVSADAVSCKLNGVINLWLSRNEIKKVGGNFILS
jgi:hypothetical protein